MMDSKEPVTSQNNRSVVDYLVDALLHPSKVFYVLLLPLSYLFILFRGASTGGFVKAFGFTRIYNKGSIKIGKGCNFFSVNAAYPSGNLSGPVYFYTARGAQINIGDQVALNGTALICELSISIGSRVMIGGNTIIQDTSSHNMFYKDRYCRYDKVERKPIVIEDDVWIGAQCIIHKGVTIGKGSVISAGSVVTMDVEPYSLYGGNPAKFIRKIDKDV